MQAKRRQGIMQASLWNCDSVGAVDDAAAG